MIVEIGGCSTTVAHHGASGIRGGDPTAPAPAPRPGYPGVPARAWHLDAALLSLVAVVIRLPALLRVRAASTFDDGVYGSAVLAMRDGAGPFREIFSSQGPLQLPLLWVADLVGFRTLDAPRLLSVASGAVITVATYAIAPRVAGRGGALLARRTRRHERIAPVGYRPDQRRRPGTGPVTTAVALAFTYRSRPSTLRAVAVGLAMGGAPSIKLLVIPAAIPVGLLLLRGGKLRALATAVGSAVVVFLAAALPWGISNVWDQSIAFHQNASRTDSYGGNAWRLVHTLCERDVLLDDRGRRRVRGVVARWLTRRTGSTIGRRMARRSPRRTRGDASDVAARVIERLERPAGMFGVWLAVQAALLMWEPQMWRPHVSEVIVPLALLVALRPPSWRAIAVVVALALPWYVVNVHTMLWPAPYRGDDAAAVGRIRALPQGAWAISDEPTFIWRAGPSHPRQPRRLVDQADPGEARDGDDRRGWRGQAAGVRGRRLDVPLRELLDAPPVGSRTRATSPWPVRRTTRDLREARLQTLTPRPCDGDDLGARVGQPWPVLAPPPGSCRQ